MPIEAPKIGRLMSDFLLPPLETDLTRAYQVTLADVPNSPGRYYLSLDPNTCVLDEFGTPRGCTFIATFPFEVGLELVMNGDGMTLYELSSDQELPARFRLVLLEGFGLRACPVRLLKLDEDGYITHMVHLHPVEAADQQDF